MSKLADEIEGRVADGCIGMVLEREQWDEIVAALRAAERRVPEEVTMEMMLAGEQAAHDAQVADRAFAKQTGEAPNISSVPLRVWQAMLAAARRRPRAVGLRDAKVISNGDGTFEITGDPVAEPRADETAAVKSIPNPLGVLAGWPDEPDDNPTNWCEPCGSFHPATTPCTEPRAEPQGSATTTMNARITKVTVSDRINAPTPRTDAAVILMCHVVGVDPDFARQLERELQEVKDHYEELITVQTRRKMQAEIADLQGRLDALQKVCEAFGEGVDGVYKLTNEILEQRKRLNAPCPELPPEPNWHYSSLCTHEEYDALRTVAIALARRLAEAEKLLAARKHD